MNKVYLLSAISISALFATTSPVFSDQAASGCLNISAAELQTRIVAGVCDPATPIRSTQTTAAGKSKAVDARVTTGNAPSSDSENSAENNDSDGDAGGVAVEKDDAASGLGKMNGGKVVEKNSVPKPKFDKIALEPAKEIAVKKDEVLELAEEVENLGLAEKVEKLDLAEKADELGLAEKADKLGLAEKADEPGLAEKADKLGLAEKSEKLDLAEKAEELELAEPVPDYVPAKPSVGQKNPAEPKGQGDDLAMVDPNKNDVSPAQKIKKTGIVSAPKSIWPPFGWDNEDKRHSGRDGLERDGKSQNGGGAIR
jgi:hypothetical protein